jgi:hypothetical protein
MNDSSDEETRRRDEARRIAANIAKLLKLLATRPGDFCRTHLNCNRQLLVCRDFSKAAGKSTRKPATHAGLSPTDRAMLLRMIHSVSNALWTLGVMHFNLTTFRMARSYPPTVSSRRSAAFSIWSALTSLQIRTNASAASRSARRSRNNLA